jgi:hypothetical protein
MRRLGSGALVCLVVTGLGCTGADDRAFARLQVRGRAAMGVDQYTSSHVFEPLPDGGRIVLQRDEEDPAGVTRIREHMQRIADAFGSGDFRLPGFVHDREVPGAAVMAASRGVISYAVDTLARGAQLRIITNDPAALKAIHEFLAFQRHDHRVGPSH